MDEDIQREIRKRIDKIEKKSADGNYIYRGEPKTHEGPPYHGKVSSSLWRDYGLEMENFDIEVVQTEILSGAKEHIGDIPQDYRADLAASLNVTQDESNQTIDFEILTEIQHYGGKTNLIDFTTDYFIALFFACDGHHNKKGRVILQKTEEIQDVIEHPRNPRHRVIAQKSIFVRPPKGFINKPHEDNVVIIPGNLKQWILQYLRKYYGISTEAIYNDLHGFIRHQDIHGGAYTEFYRGFASLKRGDEAKTRKKKRKWFKKAVKDFTQAIRLDPNQATTHVNLSIAHIRLKDYSSAIDDCDRAIAIKPNYANAYNSRGTAYLRRNELGHAIEEYCRAIALNPNYAHAYFNRGVALLHIVEIEGDGAKSDLITAKEKGLDIIAAFRYEYGSVEDFEDSRAVDLPADIAEMLTPTWT